MNYRGGKFGLKLIFLFFLVGFALQACGSDPTPTPDYSGALTAIAQRARPTTTQAPLPTGGPFEPSAPVATRVDSGEALALPSLVAPTQTATPPTPVFIPPTPILIPTPTTPVEALLVAEDLGLTAWSDTEITWSPTGDQFLLRIIRGDDPVNFYFLVRPPASPTASFRFSRAAASSFAWSPDGRYLSFIFYDVEGNPGPVEVIDTLNNPGETRELFKGPCTSVGWLGSTPKLLAACGQALYEVPLEGSPELRYKLEGSRFPGSGLELSLIARAQPSPDGNLVALYGLARQKSSLPLGEIAFYNPKSGKITLLNRDNRPVAIVDWTPDSKYLILRNLTGDWAVPYTFDYYLADPVKLKIIQNLTKTNSKCDPVLGSKLDCQGLEPSPFQAQRLLFAPDSNLFLFTGIRYVAQPNVALETVERITLGRLSTGKQEAPLEIQPGERIVAPTWLPNNHYFYSRSPVRGPAIAILDGQPVNLKSNALSALIKSGTPQPKPTLPKNIPAPSATARVGAGNDFKANLAVGNEIPLNRSANQPAPPTSTPEPAPTTPAVVVPSPGVTFQVPASLPASTSTPLTPGPGIVPTPSPLPFTGIISETTKPPESPPTPGSPVPPTATQPVIFPSLPGTIIPSGTQIIQVYTPTPYPTQEYRPPLYVPPTLTPTPRPTNTAKVIATPTPEPVQLRPVAYYISPKGNWVVSLERIANGDQPVQFQLRLIPFAIK